MALFGRGLGLGMFVQSVMALHGRAGLAPRCCGWALAASPRLAGPPRGGVRALSLAARPDEPNRTDKAVIMYDLENLSEAVHGLSRLADICVGSGTKLRVYASSASPLAVHATHPVSSNLRDAADLRITWDSALLIDGAGGGPARVLVLTRDLFGPTLASLDDRVETAFPEQPLTAFWSDRLGGAESVARVLAVHVATKPGLNLDDLAMRMQTKDPVSLLIEMAQANRAIGVLYGFELVAGEGTHIPAFEAVCSARLLYDAPALDCVAGVSAEAVATSLHRALAATGSNAEEASACATDLMRSLAQANVLTSADSGSSAPSDVDAVVRAVVGVASDQLVARGAGGSKKLAKKAASAAMLELMLQGYGLQRGG